MVTRKMAQISAVALIVFGSVLVSEVRAQVIAPAQTAPLTCTAPLAFTTSSVTIAAMPGGITNTFPYDVACPGGEGSICSKYDYKFTSSEGSNLTKSYLSVSSDLDIYAVTPAAFIENPTCEGDGNLIGRFVCEQRQIRFNPQPSGFSASVIVTRTDPRVSTAGAIVGLLSTGFCLIQGPGAPVNPFKAVTTASNQKAAGGKCDVTVTLGADGKTPVKVETSTSDCAVASQVDLTVAGSGAGGGPFQDGAPITYGTGTTTCYPTKPKPTCVCRNPSSPCPN